MKAARTPAWERRRKRVRETAVRAGATAAERSSSSRVPSGVAPVGFTDGGRAGMTQTEPRGAVGRLDNAGRSVFRGIGDQFWTWSFRRHLRIQGAMSGGQADSHIR